MTNHIDDVIESADSRKTRDRFFLCISNINGGIVHEFVKAESTTEAKATFTSTHGQAPEVVDDGSTGNGWRPVGGPAKLESEKLSVTVDARDRAKRTTTSFEAEYRGWEVAAFGIKGCTVKGRKYDDDELFVLEFLDKLPGNTDRKPRFSPTDVVSKVHLTNIKHT